MTLRADIARVVTADVGFDYYEWGEPSFRNLGVRPVVMSRYGGRRLTDEGFMVDWVEVIVLVGQTKTRDVYEGLDRVVHDLLAVLRQVGLPDQAPVDPLHNFQFRRGGNSYVGASVLVGGGQVY